MRGSDLIRVATDGALRNYKGIYLFLLLLLLQLPSALFLAVLIHSRIQQSFSSAKADLLALGGKAGSEAARGHLDEKPCGKGFA